MTKYASQSALTLRLIKAKGASVTFSRGQAQIDFVTQQVTGAPTTYTAHVLAQPLSASKARYLFGEGADITRSRLSLSMALSGVTQTPQIGDRFTWGAKSYVIATEPDILDLANEGGIYASALAEQG